MAKSISITIAEVVGSIFGELGFRVALSDLTDIKADWWEIWAYFDDRAIVLRPNQGIWFLESRYRFGIPDKSAANHLRYSNLTQLGGPATVLLVDPCFPDALERVEAFATGVLNDKR